MSLLQDKDRAAVQEAFEGLVQPVHLVLVTSEESGEYSEVARELLDEVSALHDQISLEVLDIEADAERAAALGVDKAPTVVFFAGAERVDHGVRFAGLPSGYEFATLVETIRMMGGAADTSLMPATTAFLEGLNAPLRLQVFVTPTCPYCPRAVVLAYRLAIASPHITAEGIEVSEFPELGDRYAVMGVPKTVIGEIVHIEGAAPESMMLQKLREAVAA
ncbi:MAG: protein disulfide oxidoreductase [Chloroflexaceae bacterium]